MTKTQALDRALGALADIGTSKDMTLKQVRLKANRIYKEVRQALDPSLDDGEFDAGESSVKIERLMKAEAYATDRWAKSYHMSKFWRRMAAEMNRRVKDHEDYTGVR